MDSFRLCLVIGPLAVYLLLVGAINVARRPFLVSGSRDVGALAMAVSGLMIVGPIELLFPQAAAARFGAFIGPIPAVIIFWAFLAAFYALCVTLWMLWMRPRLVIYNISPDELRPVLAELVPKLDPEARWAGDSLALPSLGVQLFADSVAPLRNVSLMSVGAAQNPAGWQKLEAALAETLPNVEVDRNPHGYGMIGTGLVMLLALVLLIARSPVILDHALLELLRS